MLTTHHLHHLHHHRGSTAVELDKVTNLNTLIVEINSHVALFRDMLIHVGQAKDCPELREKIRKLRRTCVEAFKHTAQILMPQVKRKTRGEEEIETNYDTCDTCLDQIVAYNKSNDDSLNEKTKPLTTQQSSAKPAMYTKPRILARIRDVGI
ncbi:uncharacterized protein dcma isoform X4 [Drosophila virilis]|uniref:uncharacterized protein dcma isoform X4 n=1 Tax=Drosophila virilis TaxID=7244 RepID=UPI0038B30EBF